MGWLAYHCVKIQISKTLNSIKRKVKFVNRRLTYVDGIKGMACIGVLTYHYYASFCQQVTGINFDSSTIDLVFGRVLNERGYIPRRLRRKKLFE